MLKELDKVQRMELYLSLALAIAFIGYLIAIYVGDIETEVIRDRYWKDVEPLFNGEIPIMEYPPFAFVFMIIPRLFFSDPFGYADMDKAAERVRKAFDSGERICVYGDYDCDGVTATVLLYSYFEDSGADVLYYIPDRYNEGYGLNKKAVERIRKAGASLIVTVDNGISAIDEIAYAKSIGLDVVVTDHHTPRPELPDAVAVVDPHRADCHGGCRDLAGVGVAFKLVCALEGENGETLIDQYGDIVALGTIADVVPLLGENRLIVRKGLELIEHTENYFKDKGFNNINLVTNEFQAPKFYEKCGFELEFIRENKGNPKFTKYFYIKYF